MQLVEDSGLLSSLQAPPVSLSGAIPRLQWQQLPDNAVVQHVQEALETDWSATGGGPGDRSGQVAAAVSSAPTSCPPRSTAEYSRQHERRNRLTGHARPGQHNKTMLRTLRTL